HDERDAADDEEQAEQEHADPPCVREPRLAAHPMTERRLRLDHRALRPVASRPSPGGRSKDPLSARDTGPVPPSTESLLAALPAHRRQTFELRLARWLPDLE